MSSETSALMLTMNGHGPKADMKKAADPIEVRRFPDPR